MWIKAAVLGGSGVIFSNLAVWTIAGLGIKIAFHSSHKWVNSVVAREEKDNEIDRLPEEEEKDDDEIDRLPDDILGEIVSRLTLNEASRTSILSSRWRNFWTTKSELVFNCFSTFGILNEYHDTQVANCDKQRFIKAVDQCLQLYSDHGRNRKLRKFLLARCFLNGHTCHLIRWMQTLARLEVEELHLGKPCHTRYREIPKKEYTFSFNLIDGLSRLKFLRIMCCYVETRFIGQCISLTRIDLVSLLLHGHQLSDILTSCPNLGTLCIMYCELPLSRLRISGPNLKLKWIEITNCIHLEKIEISDTNVRILFIKMHREVEISLSALPKMEELNLRTPGMNYCFGDVARDLPELQLLIIKTPHQVMRLPPTFLAFRNVRRLFLMTNGDPRPEGSEKVDLWNFAPVLVACPFLKEFYLALLSPVCKEERNAEWPVVRHEHLGFVELSGFSNTQNELEFAKFILTSAEVLFGFHLRVCPRKADDGKPFYVDESEKESKQIDARVAKAVRADLQGHALSTRALVTLL